MKFATSLIWSSASALARAATRRGVLRPAQLGARVISVGNIQAGGAGKTPVVALIANQAIARGLKTCILSRGYGGAWEHSGGVIAPAKPGSSPGPALADAALAGDEAALLHELVPGAWIGVGSDRATQFDIARRESGHPFDVAILDDGFQHWKIKKDVEVLCLTSHHFGDTWFRDFPIAANSAHLIVWTKGSVEPESHGKPMVRAKRGLKWLRGAKPKRALLLTSVADPSDVARALRESGCEVVRHERLADHAAILPELITRLEAEAKAQGLELAMTGKDWIKVPTTQCAVFEPELTIDRAEIWDAVLWGK